MKATQQNTSGIQYVMTAGDAVLTSANADIEKATVEMLYELKERVYGETGLTTQLQFSDSKLADVCLDAEECGYCEIRLEASLHFDLRQVITHFDEDAEVYYYEKGYLVDEQAQLVGDVCVAGLSFRLAEVAKTDWSDDEVYACYSADTEVRVVRAERFCLENHQYAHLLNDSSELCVAACAL